jgi:hypothetical protein
MESIRHYSKFNPGCQKHISYKRRQSLAQRERRQTVVIGVPSALARVRPRSTIGLIRLVRRGTL